ncbi:MAG: hypothetical protein STSR0008_11330 [Ignavibacterium sp.]
MDELQNLPEENENQQIYIEQEKELSHIDKLVGIFTEPIKTFEKISLFPPKTIDWLLPFFLLLLVISVSQVIRMSNPIIKSEMQEKQIQQIEKSLDEAVKRGEITRQDANQRMEIIENQMSEAKMGSIILLQTISIFVMGFIFFLIVCGVYFIFAKLIFKDNGTYSGVLVASGITSYIGILQIIVVTILSLLFSKFYQDTSLTSFLSIERTTLAGVLLSKLDPFSIWTYSITSIGIAKMFKSNNLLKYFILIFGLWIGWSLIVYLLGNILPFMKNFA